MIDVWWLAVLVPAGMAVSWLCGHAWPSWWLMDRWQEDRVDEVWQDGWNAGHASLRNRERLEARPAADWRAEMNEQLAPAALAAEAVSLNLPGPDVTDREAAARRTSPMSADSELCRAGGFHWRDWLAPEHTLERDQQEGWQLDRMQEARLGAWMAACRASWAAI
jgi:hypothetical protein